jgi:hypothetical protein
MTVFATAFATILFRSPVYGSLQLHVNAPGGIFLRPRQDVGVEIERVANLGITKSFRSRPSDEYRWRAFGSHGDHGSDKRAVVFSIVRFRYCVKVSG